MSEKHQKAIKRFGSRYGRTPKQKLSKIEVESKAAHICPYCRYKSVRKQSLGIWSCKKCNATFTGKAFSPQKNISTDEGQKGKQTTVVEEYKEPEKEVVEQEPQMEPQVEPQQPAVEHAQDSEDFGEELEEKPQV